MARPLTSWWTVVPADVRTHIMNYATRAKHSSWVWRRLHAELRIDTYAIYRHLDTAGDHAHCHYGFNRFDAWEVYATLWSPLKLP